MNQEKIDLISIINKSKKDVKHNLENQKVFNRKSIKTLSVILILILTQSVLLISFYQELEFYVFIRAIIALILLITVSIDYFVMSKMPPKKKKEFPNFYWQLELTSLTTRIIGYTIIVWITFHYNLNERSINFALLVLGFYLLFGICIIIIKSYPNNILLNQLTSVGSAAFDISLIGFGFFMVSLFYDFGSAFYPLFFLVSILFLVKRKKSWNNLNLVQAVSIKMVEPKKLIYEIKPEFKRIKDRRKALKILDDLDDSKQYGVRQELIKEILRIKNSPRNIVLSFIIILLPFILQSVGEGLVQDLLNDDIKKIICQYLNIFCDPNLIKPKD